MTDPHKTSQAAAKAYFKWVAGFSALLWTPLLLVFWFLHATGEGLSVQEVVERQFDNGGYYGSALYDTVYEHKLALYKKTKPEIAVLGTSRSMQFRGEFFNSPMINLAGAHDKGLYQMLALIDDMLAVHVPKVVIIGVEDIWLDKEAELPRRFSNSIGGENLLLRVPTVFEWIWKGRLKVTELLGALFGTHLDLGVTGVIRQSGFDRHGSYHYAAILAGAYPNLPDRQFIDTLERLATGKIPFKRDIELDPGKWLLLEQALSRFRNKGVSVITFVPPLVQVAIDRTKGDPGYSHLMKMNERLRGMSSRHFDFRDPSTVGSPPCEFINGTHGGDVTYLRILREMARDSDSPFRPFLDIKRAAEIIQRYAGRAAIIGMDISRFGKEKDHLDIGCSKPPLDATPDGTKG